MCGIAGILAPNWSPEQLKASVMSMSECLAHRGPDDSGTFFDDQAGLALAHRRLSIIDTSKAGQQPMCSSSGRWVVVFNGEVYNANELRAACSPSAGFRGHCDTEVLCELIDSVGPRQAAERLVGMFSFAAWDTKERVLYLVRDRIGIKPLYLASNEREIAFASELSALRQIPQVSGGVSASGLAGLLRYGFVPGHLSILEHVQKVCPGTIVKISLKQAHLDISSERWWSITESSRVSNERIDDQEALDQISLAIENSIRDRLISDRPIGAFLSGGIDSSLVVAGMAALSSAPVQTYSIGFTESLYDESPFARGVARHLGTSHSEQLVTERDVLDIVPELGGMFDEPFADSSQIPMSLVCRLARKDVVVALSGDGGDELFGGYDRYMWSVRLWDQISKIPRSMRRAIALGMTPIPAGLAGMIGRAVNGVVPSRMRVLNPTDKFHRVRRILASRDIHELYQGLMHCFDDPQLLMQQQIIEPDFSSVPTRSEEDPVESMMLTDLLGYLPNDLLVKVDRTSMNVGLEARVPLLDHRLVELAWSLPMRLKVRDGVGKWALRQLLQRQVPSEFWNRPKQGFAVPIGQWLRGPLRDWGEALLAEERLRMQGYLRPTVVRRLWNRHQSGAVDSGSALWTLLMFQAWLDESPSVR